MKLDESQQKAISLARDKKLSCITGSAGTGKTTIIKYLAEELDSPVLTAPTGKAAARLREATGYEARTIHSIMKFDGATFNAGNLNNMNLIMDESSMADANLVGAICKRKPASLTLVGDNSQLHPVGAGAPFHDLCRLKSDLEIQLSTCYRSEEAVFKAGHMVRDGEFPGVSLTSENEKWQFVAVTGPETAEDWILQTVRQQNIDFNQDLVIVPTNGKKNGGDEYPPATVNKMNKEILDLVNPHTTDIKFDVGDRVICTQNFPAEDVWNGTTGTVTAVCDNYDIWVETDVPTRDEAGELQAETLFGKDMREKTQHAYCLTIHKAQGSQYRDVYIVACNRDRIMLSRPLLYTAITRAQRTCTLVGQRPAVQFGLQNIPERRTVLQEIANADTTGNN